MRISSDTHPFTVRPPQTGASSRQRIARTAGQSLVEFALVGPTIICLLFAGLMALQHILTSYTVQQAADAAANRAALIGGDDPLHASVVNEAHLVVGSGPGMQARDATVVVDCAVPCRRYRPITVTVQYRGHYWVPVGPFQQLTVQARATRASEQDRLPTAAALRPTRTATPAATATPVATATPAATAIPTPTPTATPVPPVDLALHGSGYVAWWDASIAFFGFQVRNSSPSPASDVVVTTVLPPGLTLRHAGGAQVSGHQVTWHLGALAPGAVQWVTLSVFGAAPGTTMTGSVTTSSVEARPDNNTATITISP